MRIAALLACVLASAALPLSGPSVQTTCSLQVARAGVEATPLSINDAGVLQVKQILDSVMEHAKPNTVLLADMESALQGRYGSGSVITQIEVPLYHWEYDPASDTWKFICSQEGLLYVDDGGASPVVARANFKVPYDDPE